MSWRVEWTPTASRALLRMPWREAARVAAAVERFAVSGEGRILRLDTDEATTFRLLVSPYTVRMIMDPLDRVLHVLAVYRVR
jgi:mRNA-degrading endonuclease RelE of RelBE toxin-antitoxin system